MVLDKGNTSTVALHFSCNTTHSHTSVMWGSSHGEVAEDVPTPASLTVDPSKLRTPRRLPNIWPDLRPKPPPRQTIYDDEHFSEAMNKYQVGQRILVDVPSSLGVRRAQIEYIGKTQIAPGYWIGVRYDEPVGKNDGEILGERLFDCPKNHGGFVRPNLCKIDYRPPPPPPEVKKEIVQAAVEKKEPEKKKKRRPGQTTNVAEDAAKAAPPPPSTELSAEGEPEMPETQTIPEAPALTEEDGGKEPELPREDPEATVATPLSPSPREGSRKGKKGRRTKSSLPLDGPRVHIQPREAWLTSIPKASRLGAIESLVRIGGLTHAEATSKHDAAFAAKKNWEVALRAAELDKKRAAAYASRAEGPGLSTCIVRQLGCFTIVAHDCEGNRRLTGGESLAVAIRGTSNVRARLTDNEDGSYTCMYRAWVSGVYTVAIWLDGEPVGKSPYTLDILSTKANASKCDLRGNGLKTCVSREPASFEVEFVDAFGQVCYAEELDVYVELVHSERQGPSSGAHMKGAIPLGLTATRAPTKYLQPERTQSTEATAPANGGATASMSAEASASAAKKIAAPAETAQASVSAATGTETANAGKWNEMVSEGAVDADGAAKASDTTQLQSAPNRPTLTIESFLAQGGGMPIAQDGELQEPDMKQALGGRRASLIPKQLDLIVPKTDYVRLDSVERQQHMQLWARRKATDLAIASAGKQLKLAARRQDPSKVFSDASTDAAVAYDHELKADRKGVGFAYGGVSPGTLHAKGQLVRVHTVHYSLGLAGQYRLHVGLRQQSIPLPGSPFHLTVVPGDAYASSSKLPKESLPLRGVVGEQWRGMVMFAADKIGNRCVNGGANVQIHVDHEGVEAICTDNGDGSYGFKWRSERSGTYQVAVTINSIPVIGSPTTLTMLAANLDVGNCEATGVGLEKAVAGKPASLCVSCKDRFANLATPATTLKFGISIAQEITAQEAKEKRKKGQDLEEQKRGRSRNEDRDEEARERKRRNAMDALSSHPFEGMWVDGEYEISYLAQKAGDHQLHIWADPEGNGERIAMPGSPFSLHVVENSPSPASSNIGYPQEERKNIYAGEKLSLRPQLRDEFGNPSAAPEGELIATLEAPDGTSNLPVKPSNKGLGSYEVSCESFQKGEYTLRVELNGFPISGSPGVFFVQPAVPTAVKSKLLPPPEPWLTHTDSQLVLIAVDKLGNTLDRGGARVDARVLGPNAGSCTVEDRKDGTYTITFTAGAVGEYRVIARLDNVEMTPLPLQFSEGGSKGAASTNTEKAMAEMVAAKLAESKGKPGSKATGKQRGGTIGADQAAERVPDEVESADLAKESVAFKGDQASVPSADGGSESALSAEKAASPAAVERISVTSKSPVPTLEGLTMENPTDAPKQTPKGTPKGTPKRTPKGTPKGTPRGQTPLGTPKRPTLTLPPMKHSPKAASPKPSQRSNRASPLDTPKTSHPLGTPKSTTTPLAHPLGTPKTSATTPDPA